jgi:hypothetical protein
VDKKKFIVTAELPITLRKGSGKDAMEVVALYFEKNNVMAEIKNVRTDVRELTQMYKMHPDMNLYTLGNIYPAVGAKIKFKLKDNSVRYGVATLLANCATYAESILFVSKDDKQPFVCFADDVSEWCEIDELPELLNRC